MVVVAQLVRAPGCGPGGRGFETHLPPRITKGLRNASPFLCLIGNAYRLHLTYFISKLSGADLKESKPHPEIFKNAAKASGFLPSECMVIEDSTNGITAAKAAGIYCVGYNSVHSKNQSYDDADLIITNFNEISFDKITAFFNKNND